MEFQERVDLYFNPSDYGCFQLKVSSVTDSSTQEKSLVRHYRCNSSATIQPLRQTWVFVKDHSHPHLGTVKRIDDSTTELTVYTEYHPTTLAKWLENFETCLWDEETTARQLTGLVEVLAEAQRNQVTHRRLTPDYIYLDETCSTLKLMDFAPCSLDAEDDQRFVRNLNPRYLSPERCSRHWTFSLQNVAKADVYSLVMVALDIIYSHDALNHPLSSLLEALSEAPALKQILDPMLQIDPQQRPDFLRLRVHLKGDSVPIEVLYQPTAAPKPSVSPPPLPAAAHRCPKCNRIFSFPIKAMCSSCETNPLKNQLSSRIEPEIDTTIIDKPVKIAPKPQKAVERRCKKCKNGFYLMPTAWREQRWVVMPENKEELESYCSEKCVPEELKPNEEEKKLENLEDIIDKVPEKQEKVEKKVEFVPNLMIGGKPFPLPQDSGEKEAKSRPMPGPPRIPTVSDPFVLPPNRSSAHVEHSRPPSDSPSHPPQNMSQCIICLKSFPLPNPTHSEYSAYALSFCSEACQIKAFGLPDLSQHRKCLQCGKGVGVESGITLECGHILCSNVCGKAYLDTVFDGVNEENRNLECVTCPICYELIPSYRSLEWLHSPAFAPPKASVTRVTGSRRVERNTCDGCGARTQTDFLPCAHWSCSECQANAGKSGCPKCRASRP